MSDLGGRRLLAAALVPLAVGSAAWTWMVAGIGPSQATPDLPSVAAGPQVPAEAVQAPASVATVTTGSMKAVLNATTAAIPAPALAAYQRAEDVLWQADPSCGLEWELVAAIGRVESDHGRANDNRLTPDGLAVPGIVGIPLDGRDGVAQILDTDNGRWDHDKTFDRAVGPMQFIPSTWDLVAVDGDSDGVRDPQDIDDAALATAVYLCSGPGDLSTSTGRQAAVYRYNHSDAYVQQVLAIYQAYVDGWYTPVDSSTWAAPYLTQDPDWEPPVVTHPGNHQTPTQPQAPTSQPETPTTTTEPPTQPTTPTAPADPDETKGPVTQVADDVTDTVDDTVDTVTDTVASVAQLTQVCTQAIKDVTGGAAPEEAVDRCVDQLTGQTLEQAKKNVDDVVAGLLELIEHLLDICVPLLGPCK